ncbi:hypothetical protein E4T48_01787 [Aureobasidium sp. EXF-10727]|nr:hypothetical protein E4T48_01787 [Aureobasidium sp. EXF-10727]
MLSSTLLSALSAATTVSAAKTYLAYAWNETAPEIHGMAVQARNGYFYLGGQAYPHCAEDAFDCIHNQTLITGPSTSKYSENLDGFFMSITDAQPQEIVTAPKTGELLYTLPKTELASMVVQAYSGGSINTPFSVDHDDFSGETVLRFNGNDFASCPTHSQVQEYGWQPYSIRALSYGGLVYKDQVYQVGVECIPFKMRLVETELPAPEYYEYPCTEYYYSVSGQEGHYTCLNSLYYDCSDNDTCTDEEKRVWATKTSVNKLQYGMELCQCRDFTDGAPGLGVAS